MSEHAVAHDHAHSHDHDHGHSHGGVDASLLRSREAMRTLWSDHPKFFEVSACAEVSEKINRVETILNTLQRH